MRALVAARDAVVAELQQMPSTLQAPGLQAPTLLLRKAMAVKSNRMKRYHGTLKWAFILVGHFHFGSC